MRWHARHGTLATALFAALLFASAGIAHAQEGGVGVRAGVSVDPDQFHIGGHAETGPLVDRLSFRPNIELGIGDNLTLIALNLEFAYRIPIQRRPWSAYIGGGPAVNLYSFDEDGRGRRGDDTEVEGGFNIMVGFDHREGLFVELKVGAMDSPDLKFTVGYTFR